MFTAQQFNDAVMRHMRVDDQSSWSINYDAFSDLLNAEQNFDLLRLFTAFDWVIFF